MRTHPLYDLSQFPPLQYGTNNILLYSIIATRFFKENSEEGKIVICITSLNNVYRQ